MTIQRIVQVAIVAAMLVLAGAWAWGSHDEVAEIGRQDRPPASPKVRPSQAAVVDSRVVASPTSQAEVTSSIDTLLELDPRESVLETNELETGDAPVEVGTPERPQIRVTVLGGPQAELTGGTVRFMAMESPRPADVGKMWVVEYDETGKCAFSVWPGITYRFSVMDNSGAIGDALLTITGIEHELTIVLFHSFNCELLLRDQFDLPAAGVALDLYLHVDEIRSGYMSKLTTDEAGTLRVSIPPHFTHAKPHIRYDMWKTYHRDSIRQVNDTAPSEYPLPISRQVVVLQRLLPEETPGVLRFVFPDVKSTQVDLDAGYWSEAVSESGFLNRKFSLTSAWSLGVNARGTEIPIYPGPVEGRLTTRIDGVDQIMFFSLQVRGAGTVHSIPVVWQPAAKVKVVLIYEGDQRVDDVYYMIDGLAWERKRTRDNVGEHLLALGEHTLTLLSEKFQITAGIDYTFDVTEDTMEVVVPIQDRTGPVVSLAGFKGKSIFYAESLDGHYGRIEHRRETSESEASSFIVYPGRWRIRGPVDNQWQYCDLVVYPNQPILTLTPEHFRPQEWND